MAYGRGAEREEVECPCSRAWQRMSSSPSELRHQDESPTKVMSALRDWHLSLSCHSLDGELARPAIAAALVALARKSAHRFGVCHLKHAELTPEAQSKSVENSVKD